MIEAISAAIAGVSAIIAVISAVAVYYQTRRGWHVSVLAPQRLEWAENLRDAVAAFMSAFYNNEDLQSHRARIFLYLNPGNENHISLINAVDSIYMGEDFEMDRVIAITQNLLRWNWWTAKSEAEVSHREESRWDKKTKERTKQYYSQTSETEQTHAEAQGQSVNGFINAAIDEKMGKPSVSPVEAENSHECDGAVSLHPEALRTAQEAAQSAGETVPQFVERAVATQAQCDRLGINPATGGKLEKEA